MKAGQLPMSETSLTQKEAIWLACKAKSCCYSSFVLPSGRDVWRISRVLDMQPWAFVVYFQTPKPRPDSFILDGSGRHFRIALAKQQSRRKKTPPPCIFLLRTRNGYHRCGLGDLRPQVCHSFPSDLMNGVLCVPNDTGCTCRKWSLADVDITEETRAVEARQAEYQEYCSLVAFWNEQVASAPEGSTFAFVDFCEFLLDAYDQLDVEESEESVEVAP
jgi:Fe-S-cluster containining protein